MFKFIYKRPIIQLVILVLLFAYSTYRLISHAEFLLPDGMSNCYKACYNFLSAKPVLTFIVLFAILLLYLFILLRYFNQSSFVETYSYMPAIWSLALMNCMHFFDVITPLYFIILIIALLLLLYLKYEDYNIKHHVFFSGVLVGIASLIDMTAALLIIFVIASLVVNRFSKAKDIVISILGILTTYIYYVSYYFLTDQVELLRWNFATTDFFVFYQVFSPFSIKLLIFTILFFFLTFYSTSKLKLFFDNKLIVLRKRLIAVNIIFATCFIIFICSPLMFKYSLCYFIVPFALYFSLLNLTKGNQWFNDILIILFSVSLCL